MHASRLSIYLLIIVSVISAMLRACPEAAAVPDASDRLPLALAVHFRHPVPTLRILLEASPDAVAAFDGDDDSNSNNEFFKDDEEGHHNVNGGNIGDNEGRLKLWRVLKTRYPRRTADLIFDHNLVS
jgi:hypothetical protein